MRPRLRFAPSPTGSLHLGNARTALFNWLVARGRGGTLALRIEDTDTRRESEGSEAAILDDLRWLGLSWDEGPDVGGPLGPYRQSERLDRYAGMAGSLLSRGAAFRCFCTEPATEGSPHHAGHRDPCRSAPEPDGRRRAEAGEAFVVRFKVPARTVAEGHVVVFHDRLHGEVRVPLAQIPDAVLLRGDGRPTYNFAAAVDDAAMAIDLVLRGDDHLSNTPLQVLLYQAMDTAVPEFAHVPMVLGPDGERLSKRHGATSVAAWRAHGVLPEALVNALALLGWSPPGDRTIVGRDELVREFDLDRVGRSAAVFEPAKLEWIASQYVRRMPADALTDEVSAALVRAGRITAAQARVARAWTAELAEFLRPALARFDAVARDAEPVFHAGGAAAEQERASLMSDEASRVLAAFLRRLAAVTALDGAGWTAIKDEVSAETGVRGRGLFQPVRIALTGSAHGRELDRLVPLIVSGHRVLAETVPSAASRLERTLASLA
ncbi:MAG TPA: glutamate--tRNA ligase [Candidatus Polarisedimenticolaceae bacterium]|nr:glutamate--tRNA ligase [Candidatus Polarisedimenticolaceae bacterium]